MIIQIPNKSAEPMNSMMWQWRWHTQGQDCGKRNDFYDLNIWDCESEILHTMMLALT